MRNMIINDKDDAIKPRAYITPNTRMPTQNTGIPNTDIYFETSVEYVYLFIYFYITSLSLMRSQTCMFMYTWMCVCEVYVCLCVYWSSNFSLCVCVCVCICVRVRFSITSGEEFRTKLKRKSLTYIKQLNNLRQN